MLCGTTLHARGMVSRQQSFSGSPSQSAALREAVRNIATAWYGGLRPAAAALGVNYGSFWMYCAGQRNIPRRVVVGLLAGEAAASDRRERRFATRIEKIIAKRDAAREKARQAAVVDAPVLRAWIDPPANALLWGHTGYQDIRKTKPHPKRLAQTRDSGPTADRSLTDSR